MGIIKIEKYCIVFSCIFKEWLILYLDYRFAVQSEWTSGPGFGSERHSTWSGHGNTFL